MFKLGKHQILNEDFIVLTTSNISILTEKRAINKPYMGGSGECKKANWLSRIYKYCISLVYYGCQCSAQSVPLRHWHAYFPDGASKIP